MKLKFVAGIFFLIVSVSNCGLISTEGKITSLDFPKELSDKVDTIEVAYIAWACACPNWLPDKYFDLDNDKLSKNPENYCIFLEAERDKLRISEQYYLQEDKKRIKLIGKFYNDKGISRDFEQPTVEKPKYAKVFKCSEIEYLN